MNEKWVGLSMSKQKIYSFMTRNNQQSFHVLTIFSIILPLHICITLGKYLCGMCVILGKTVCGLQAIVLPELLESKYIPWG